MARPPKLDDDEILDRAVAVFWRQGWSATSIRQLEVELDLKAPSIYRRFGSKDGLARAVLDRYVERVIVGRVERHLGGVGDPLANVREFIESALRPGAAGRPLVGCLLTVTAAEFPSVDSGLSHRLAEGLALIERAIREELERAVDGGWLDGDADPSALAAGLGLSFQGLMVLARSGVDPGELQARVDQLFAVTLDPYRPERSSARSATSAE